MSQMYCPFCMSKVQGDVCPYCGNSISYTGDPMHLQVGYVLNGMHPYVLGASLGQGGFGITYIALDIVDNRRVAIKEYFPTYCAGRNGDVTVASYRGQEGNFSKGKERFLDEARMLKSLSDLPGVVDVLDFFEANNSAYLVMEFLEGSSLKGHVERSGKLSAQPFLQQMKPLMADVEKMHRRGVIHRDIAPDNIIMLPDGRLKLIDFGAARSYLGDKSMTVVVKKGFAPVEQYMRKGGNASTDVYALAATIYYCITGVVPADSAERQYGEELQAPTKLGAELSREQELALEKALAIQPMERSQSVEELMNGLDSSKPSASAVTSRKNTKTEKSAEEKNKPAADTKQPFPSFDIRIPAGSKGKNASHPKWLIPVVAAAAVVIGGIALLAGSDDKQEPAVSVNMNVTETASEPETSVEPTVPEIQEETIPVQTYVMQRWLEDVINGTFCGQSVYTEDDVISLKFLSSLDGAPSDAQDISEAQDRSILTWLDEGEMIIAANGRIAPNPNASGLFSYWESLEKIEFGDAFDTSDVTDMSSMFEGANLSELDVSCFDTANVTTMREMFKGCENLKKLDLRGFDTGSVTDMYRMFDDCETLTELDVSSFDTSNVKDFGGMFATCESLSQLDVSGFDTSSATNLTQMFIGMNNVGALDVSGFDTSKVTKMTGMFSSCHKVKSLDVSGFDTSNVTDMSNMFNYCRSVSTLDVSSFDTSNVTDMGSMFGNCEGLVRLDLRNFDTSNVTDMFQMFCGNKNLVSLNVSSFDTSRVTDMRSMFSGCSALSELDVSSFKIAKGADIKGMFNRCTFQTPSWYKE